MGICLILQTEFEIIEEINIDRVNEFRGYVRSRQMKGYSEIFIFSFQFFIDEVRQQMYMLLEEVFSLAFAGYAGQSRYQDVYGFAQYSFYSEVVISVLGIMTRFRVGVQWVLIYCLEMYQYSLFRSVSQIRRYWLFLVSLFGVFRRVLERRFQ